MTVSEGSVSESTVSALERSNLYTIYESIYRDLSESAPGRFRVRAAGRREGARWPVTRVYSIAAQPAAPRTSAPGATRGRGAFSFLVSLISYNKFL